MHNFGQPPAPRTRNNIMESRPARRFTSIQVSAAGTLRFRAPALQRRQALPRGGLGGLPRLVLPHRLQLQVQLVKAFQEQHRPRGAENVNCEVLPQAGVLANSGVLAENDLISQNQKM